MHVGAIITIPSGNPPQRGNSHAHALPENRNGASLLAGSPIAHWDVLGESVLNRVLQRLQTFGVSEIVVIPDDSAAEDWADYAATPQRNSWPIWDDVVSRYLSFGLETLLLVRVGAYVEVDVQDLFSFHREICSPVTQLYDEQGALDFLVIDGRELRDGTGSFRSRLKAVLPKHRRYPFTGYTNRLKDAGDFRRLAKDALWGRAAIRPLGHEVQPNVWVGEGAEIDNSANFAPPAYVGKKSRVNAACTVGEASTVEQYCEVDCGTQVIDSSVLPHTYLGMGLNVRNAVISEHTLFHLGRNVQMQFHDSRLIGDVPATRRLLRSARSFLRAADSFVAADQYCQPGSHNWHL